MHFPSLSTITYTLAAGFLLLGSTISTTNAAPTSTTCGPPVQSKQIKIRNVGTGDYWNVGLRPNVGSYIVADQSTGPAFTIKENEMETGNLIELLSPTGEELAVTTDGARNLVLTQNLDNPTSWAFFCSSCPTPSSPTQAGELELVGKDCTIVDNVVRTDNLYVGQLSNGTFRAGEYTGTKDQLFDLYEWSSS